MRYILFPFNRDAESKFTETPISFEEALDDLHLIVNLLSLVPNGNHRRTFIRESGDGVFGN